MPKIKERNSLTQEPVLYGWARETHQLSQQINCGVTAGSETSEKLEVWQV